MTAAMILKLFKTVDDLGREVIDSLVDDAFFTYGWFKTLETSKFVDLKPFYIGAFIEDKLAAFAPCFYDVADQFFLFTPISTHFLKPFLRLRKRLGLGKEHVLLCFSPSCFRSKIFVQEGLNEGLVTNCLSGEIDRICREEKILFSSFLFVSEFDRDLLLQLTIAGYHRLPETRRSFYLPLRWRSFENYIASLRHGIRNNVKREIKKLVENGIAIENLGKFKDHSRVLSDLSSNLHKKYNGKRTRLYEPSFYENLNDYFAKGNARVFLAKKKDAVIGFALLLRHGKTADVFQCGFDYELQEKSDFTYFNVAYYSPIRWAIQEGIEKIYYRHTNDRVKTRRGCKPEGTYAVIKCQNKQINAQIGSYLNIKNSIKQTKL
jgi:predicted N-acyltransferase